MTVPCLRVALPAVALALLLAACSNSKNELPGVGYLPPSDVTTTRTIPLTVPPDFGVRPQAQQTDANGATVIEAIVAPPSIDVSALDATMGEQALMMRSGVMQANPDIRRVLQRENAVFAGNDELVDIMMFGDFPAGTSIQLEEGPDVGPDIAIGQGEAPTTGSWLDDVFNIF